MPIHKAKKAIIMLHGRGASADGIVELEKVLSIDDFTILAPQASDHSWYPNSFTAPVESNQPYLNDALILIDELVNELNKNGIFTQNIHILGFSQGACLALEYTARNAKAYGGVIAFSGGLIGEKAFKNNYKGNYKETKIFLGCSDVDPHIPLVRVDDTAEILSEMGGNVHKNIYKNMPHTIIKEEVEFVNQWIFS